MAVFEGVVNGGASGLAHAAYGSGRWGEGDLAMLSDGTLLTTVWATSTTVGVRYSTDGGETWTQCATTIVTNGVDGGDQHRICADEFDYVYVAHTSASAGNSYITACTFTGTDITSHGSKLIIFQALGGGSLKAFDNPTISGDQTHVLVSGFHNSGDEARLYSVDFNRATEIWNGDAASLVASEDGGSVGGGYSAHLVLETSVTDSRILATPSAPRGTFVFRRTITIRGLPLTWNGTTHKFNAASAVGSSTVNGTGRFAVIYDPTINKTIAVQGENATSSEVFTGDMPLTAWTARADRTFASGPMKFLALALLTDGQGNVKLVHLENDDIANIDLNSHAWDDGTNTFDAEVLISAVENLEAEEGGWQGSVWNPSGWAMAMGWMSDNTNQPRIYVHSSISAVGAFKGWGIPIGI